MLPEESFFDPNVSDKQEKLSDVLAAIEKENADLISFSSLFSGLSDKSNKEKDNKEIAEEFGKSVVEEQKHDIRENPDLDALMMGPSQIEPYEKEQQNKDLRFNPDLDALFGFPTTTTVVTEQETKAKTEQQDNAFKFLDALASIEIPKTNSESAERPKLPKSETEQQDNAFKFLDALASIEIPKTNSGNIEQSKLPESKRNDVFGFSDAWMIRDFDTNPVNKNTQAETPYQEENESFKTLSQQLDNLGFLPFVDSKEIKKDKESEENSGAGVSLIDGLIGDKGDTLLYSLLERLASSIDKLSESVLRFADTLDPREPLSDYEKEQKEKAEKERAYQKEEKPLWEMYLSGYHHDYESSRKEQFKKPGKLAKSFGEEIGEGAGKWSAISEQFGASEGGGISQLAGIFGGLSAGVGMFASAIGRGKDTIIEWNENLMRSNFQFAEFSGAMSKAQAEMEVRDMMYSRDRGDARADSADELAKSWSELKSTFAPIGDALANMWNSLLTILNKMLTALGKLIGLGDRPEDRIGDVESALVGSVEGAWLETYGVTPRWR